jgi:C4-dicarboxylate transporter DctM subunit
LGLLFPPCLPLILYAIIAKISSEQMFLGGVFPGVLMVLMTAWWGIHQGPKIQPTNQFRFKPNEARAAIWQAKWELMLPVVAFWGLFSGFATPVEAAALTAFYAFVFEVFIYKDLSLIKDIPRVMTE